MCKFLLILNFVFNSSVRLVLKFSNNDIYVINTISANTLANCINCINITIRDSEALGDISVFTNRGTAIA